ncbi:MAG: rod shape-determining protein MreC [Pseudomonadota bacterium]|nr:rod shape-determining protein MreC [Pseudomonadota bacterium]
MAVAGVLFAVLLLVVAAIDPRGFAALRGAALDATAPISTAGRSVAGFFGGIADSVGDYFRAGSQNAELRRQLEEAQPRIHGAEALELENRRLRQLLGLAAEVEDEITIARIVGSTFLSGRRLATLSAGSQSGVAAGQPVRAPEGLIGRVLETGRWAARVLLVTDTASSVPVRLVRDGTPALAVGRGDGTIELRTLEVGANPFRPGDVMATSGVGGIFPPNVPVAEVVRIEDSTAIARPLADPARADFAIVQRPYQPAANAPLDQAPPLQSGPATVSPGQAPEGALEAATPPPRQQSPHYQPALQRPQPVTSNLPREEPRR